MPHVSTEFVEAVRTLTETFNHSPVHLLFDVRLQQHATRLNEEAVAVQHKGKTKAKAGRQHQAGQVRRARELYYGDHDVDEIAAIMRLKPRTVRRMLTLPKARLGDGCWATAPINERVARRAVSLAKRGMQRHAIATRLGISRATVQRCLRKAKKK